MSVVYNRYARAFAEVLQEKQVDFTQAVEELRAVAETISGSADLKRVWSSPAISSLEKHNLLRANRLKIQPYLKACLKA